jgi:alpha-glucosidase
MDTWPIAKSPDALVVAMQTGDRLGYHPETASAELRVFLKALAAADTSIAALRPGFIVQLDDYIKQSAGSSWNAVTIQNQAERQKRLDALDRARFMIGQAGR